MPSGHLTDWVYSPDPDVEQAVTRAALQCPVHYVGGLERTLSFLDKLGQPQHRLPPVFHVSGTNGKGSTLAHLQAILESAGKTVHKYISPHLVRFEERIILGGKEIERDTLLGLIDEGLVHAADCGVSFFEFFTALAFLAFARHPADVVLLETGLGGRLDATNVVDENIVSIITRISYDHTAILGDTLSAIAAEKAGIIKHDCPVIIAHQPNADVLNVFQQKALSCQAPLFRYGQDWDVRSDLNWFYYHSKEQDFHLPMPALPGRHQMMNAGCALAAIEQSIFKNILTEEIVSHAMRAVVWPGRLQCLTRGPLADAVPKEWDIFLDGAHNDSGAEVLADYFKGIDDSRPLHIIAMMKDGKDSIAFFKTLRPFTHSGAAVDQDLHLPMLSGHVLCDHMRAAGISVSSLPYSDVLSAVKDLTRRFSSPQRILITGSLYFAGHVLRDNG